MGGETHQIHQPRAVETREDADFVIHFAQGGCGCGCGAGGLLHGHLAAAAKYRLVDTPVAAFAEELPVGEAIGGCFQVAVLEMLNLGGLLLLLFVLVSSLSVVLVLVLVLVLLLLLEPQPSRSFSALSSCPGPWAVALAPSPAASTNGSGSASTKKRPGKRSADCSTKKNSSTRLASAPKSAPPSPETPLLLLLPGTPILPSITAP